MLIIPRCGPRTARRDIQKPRHREQIVRYAFGDCELDTQLYLLHRHGKTTALRPKVFRTLLYLVEHRERVVSREELAADIWA
ncbi:MAG: winged helix-turn-helix domain-containing protein, partial [Gammaproteobacteria bacterium]